MGAFDRNLAACLYADQPAPDWITARRMAARDAWGTTPWPTRKTEAWKYTSLEALDATDYLRRADAREQQADVATAIPALDADRIVFVNGVYQPGLSSVAAQDGVRLLNFRSADAEVRRAIDTALGEVAGPTGNPFAVLNGLWLEDGVLLQVDAGVQAARPVHVVHVGAPQEAPFAYAQRLLAVIGKRAEVELIEHFIELPGTRDALVTGLSELRVGDGAQLRHYRLHLEHEHAAHVGGVHIELGRDARCESLAFLLGGVLKRTDVHLHHRGQGASAQLDGIYLARHQQHVDLHTNVEHEVAHASTDQLCRGIIDDAAHAVFNGRIHIHPQAQKSSAELNNRNLLLSNDAEIDTKPELEIYADDVRCAHGATVSRIDSGSLYYLLTRGIERKEAEVLLGYGFLNELLGRIGDEAVAALLRDVIRSWLGRQPVMQGDVPG